jgi:hypothetical protein
LVEPIIPDQLANPYLAPIATECAQCSRFWFSTTALIDADADFAVTNPIGLQCQSCRYTLCRDCLMPACFDAGRSFGVLTLGPIGRLPQRLLDRRPGWFPGAGRVSPSRGAPRRCR